MKWLAWIITVMNAYFGIYFLLNAFNILKSSKYSQTATVVFAVLFILMTAAAVYIMITKPGYKLALLIGAGPWILSLLFLLFNMLTSDYK